MSDRAGARDPKRIERDEKPERETRNGGERTVVRAGDCHGHRCCCSCCSGANTRLHEESHAGRREQHPNREQHRRPQQEHVRTYQPQPQYRDERLYQQQYYDRDRYGGNRGGEEIARTVFSMLGMALGGSMYRQHHGMSGPFEMMFGRRGLGFGADCYSGTCYGRDYGRGYYGRDQYQYYGRDPYGRDQYYGRDPYYDSYYGRGGRNPDYYGNRRVDDYYAQQRQMEYYRQQQQILQQQQLMEQQRRLQEQQQRQWQLQHRGQYQHHDQRQQWEQWMRQQQQRQHDPRQWQQQHHRQWHNSALDPTEEGRRQAQWYGARTEQQTMYNHQGVQWRAGSFQQGLPQAHNQQWTRDNQEWRRMMLERERETARRLGRSDLVFPN